jgi:hypothetical protein
MIVSPRTLMECSGPRRGHRRSTWWRGEFAGRAVPKDENLPLVSLSTLTYPYLFGMVHAVTELVRLVSPLEKGSAHYFHPVQAVRGLPWGAARLPTRARLRE